MQLDEELEQIRGTVQYLRDRQDILDCITRESRGRDRHDAEMTASCYWADGADEHGLFITPGPEYGEKANAGHRAAFSGNSHQLQRRNGEWKIKLRRTVIDMVAEGDAAWLSTPAISGFLKGVRSKEDPSYQRPVRRTPADLRW